LKPNVQFAIFVLLILDLQQHVQQVAIAQKAQVKEFNVQLVATVLQNLDLLLHVLLEAIVLLAPAITYHALHVLLEHHIKLLHAPPRPTEYVDLAGHVKLALP
jgi:hypothetical protein